MEEHAGAQPGSGAEAACAAEQSAGDDGRADLSLAGSAASCTTRASRVPSANGNANANAERSDVLEMMEPDRKAAQAKEEPEHRGEQAAPVSSATDIKQAPNSELVNKPGRDEPSIGTTVPVHTANADSEILQDSPKLPEPNTVGPDTNAGKAKSTEESNGGSLSEGLPSLDSLDSFSNLNSCPSSDPVSETLEDQDKAQTGAHQGQQVDEGAKGPSSKERCGPVQSIYHIKWIKWKEENTPIITQNENGPCPLLAIMNVLLLAWKVKLPPMMEIITAEQLMEYLGDYILDAKPKEISEAQRLNYEQNMSDAMAVLHKLQTGLDVNVKFTGVRVFEYTPECIVFDLLDIPLYHGWLVEPQMSDIVKAVGNCSYNQLVEKIISYKQSDNSELAGEGFVAEQFLHSTATQLTYHGLCELTSTVQEGELCVFFRNNHFSTMTKFKGQLYLLVTDQGFLTEEKVVWESLHNVDGDGNFCDSEFRLRPSDPETVYQGQQDQIDQDYLMALSLQQEQQVSEMGWELPEGISDLELAKKLQEEEDHRASEFYQEQEEEQEQAAVAAQAQVQAAGGAVAEGAVGASSGAAAAAAAASASPGKHSSTSERKAKKEAKEKDKCVLL
ncbi:ubiquitin carboxyl-terminal hydrolase MINDY-2 [Trichomycterus rosablanca]|uniref:ubiquitin carboxyl-terminal hydrolase MINDY-2 n=1 Tax=Trichomycterus rosablanca TaxID=2290929 RepID=UPI002F353367